MIWINVTAVCLCLAMVMMTIQGKNESPELDGPKEEAEKISLSLTEKLKEKDPLEKPEEEERLWEELEEERPWEEDVAPLEMVGKEARGSKILPWPNATVPYTVSGSAKAVKKIKSALNDIQRNTCINFKARAGEVRYLEIRTGSGKCWTSGIGYPSSYKKRIVNLGPGCVWDGKIKHEVLHALGFPHEHCRPDRDLYVKVKWGNIKDGTMAQFYKENRYDVDIPYDYKSIMHYGGKTFAKNPSLPTLVALNWTLPMGNSDLSWRDKRKINIFHGCPP